MIPQQSLKEQTQSYAIAISGLRTSQIKTQMAILNTVIYGLVRDAKATANKDGRYILARAKIGKLLRQSQGRSLGKFQAVVGAAKYAQQWWGGHAKKDPKTFRKAFHFMADLGLFKIPPTKKGQREKQRLHAIDLVACLLYYHQLEVELASRTLEDDELQYLPKHKGNFVRLLYNMVFSGLGWRFRRQVKEGSQDALKEDVFGFFDGAVLKYGVEGDRAEVATLPLSDDDLDRLLPY